MGGEETFCSFNPLTTYFLLAHQIPAFELLLMIKRDINQQDFKIVTSILSNLNNFHSLEVVYRVSETQLQVSENYN